MDMITLEEFMNTVYYTITRIVLPLLDIRLDKKNYFIKGKYNQDEVDKHIKIIFNEYYGG